MINNTGYEEDYYEVVHITEEIMVSMFTEPTYHYTDDIGYMRTSKEPQQLWMNVALFHIDMDESLQQREFAEQADYYRYIAKLQKIAKEHKEIKADTYSSGGVIVKT